MKYLYTILIALFASTSFAQELPYTLSIFNEEYVALDDATYLTDTTAWDDPQFTVPIGFEFLFFDQVVTFLNGGLGTGGILTTSATGEGIDGIIAYGSDIIDIGYNSGQSGSTISYQTVGNFPNRIFKMDWYNCGFYNEVVNNGTSGNRVNFQLWLYEGTHDIEIRMGSHSIKTPELIHDFGSPFIGFVENLNEFEETLDGIWFLQGEPEVATVAMVEDIYGLYGAEFLADDPNEGIVYHFDSGLVGIEEPTSFESTVFPTVTSDVANISVTERIDYQLTSITGKRIAQGQLNSGISQISLLDHAEGMYVLTLSNGQQTTTHRLIKQ